MTCHFDDTRLPDQAKRLVCYLPDGLQVEFRRLLAAMDQERTTLERERADLAERHRTQTAAMERLHRRLRRQGRQCDTLQGIFRANAQAFATFRAALTLSRGLRSLAELPEVLDNLGRTMGVSLLTCLLCREACAGQVPEGILQPDREALERHLAALPRPEPDRPIFLGRIATLPQADFFFGPGRLEASPGLREGSCCICALADKYQPTRRIGALVMADPDPDRYAPDKGTDFLEHFCEAFAGDLQHVRTHEELLRQRESDELTGIPNRAFLNRHGPPLLALAERKGTPLAMLFCDLDRFKAVNDRFGHAMGDAVLTAVARSIAAQIRAYDLLVRLGGDEFVLLLPDTDQNQAQAMADRIRAAVAAAAAGSGLAGPDGLSVSIGLVRHIPGQSIEELIHRADASMYTDKRAT